MHSLKETKEGLYLGIMNEYSVHEELSWTETVTITCNNVPVTFKMDTIAETNIIQQNMFTNLQISWDHSRSVNVNLIA